MRGDGIGKGYTLLVWICLPAAIAGCKGNDGPKLVPVEGKVFFANKPLTTGFVIFHPDPDRGNPSLEEPHGAIDAEGNYKLMTRAKPGAAPGWYKIAVTAAADLDPNSPYFTKWLIPEDYINPKTSKLEREVVEQPQAGHYDLKLQAK
jgi:hypothetical protein